MPLFCDSILCAAHEVGLVDRVGARPVRNLVIYAALIDISNGARLSVGSALMASSHYAGAGGGDY